MKDFDNQAVDQMNDSSFQFDRWRQTFLKIILRAVTAIGFVLFLIYFPAFSGIKLFVFSIMYMVLLIATFAPLSYSIKAGVLLLIGYFIGIYSLLQLGPWSDSVLYFVAITLFASLLHDERLDGWVLALNSITILAIGAINSLGMITLSSTEIPDTRLIDWIIYGAKYIIIAIGLTWAISLLKTDFRSVTDRFKSSLSLLSRNRSELEDQINERTAGLIKKTSQLRAASYIARQTADMNDLETILNLVVNLITDQFGFYHAGIFLINELGDEVILHAASSVGGKKLVEKGHSFKVGAKSIVGFAAYQKKSRIALDVGADAVFFNNPELPKTRSEMALPLIIHDRVLGILDIQSDQPQAFSVGDIDVLQTLADQIAVSIENMRLLENAQTALKQVEALSIARTRSAWSQKVREGKYEFTYTPLGMVAGKSSRKSENAVNIPITLRGQKIGSLSLTRKDNAPWGDLDIDMINEVATQTGLAVDNVRLVEEATERAGQEKTVGEISTRFSQASNIDTLLQIAARELGQLADVSEVSVFIGQVSEQTPPQG